MKPLQNFDKAREDARRTASEKLPAGAYEAKIKDIKFEAGTNGNSDRFVLAFDITAGEYADFFRKQYESNTSDDKKWKGRTTVYIPKDDGSDKDEWTRKSFARWINAFEDSNPGYKWDWEENKLKDKSIGLIFGEVGTVIDGKEVLYTECRFPAAISDVREGKCKIPSLKQKNGYGTGKGSAPDVNGFVSAGTSSTEEEIPFI